jgi:type I restriction enzyme S subunit
MKGRCEKVCVTSDNLVVLPTQRDNNENIEGGFRFMLPDTATVKSNSQRVLDSRRSFMGLGVSGEWSSCTIGDLCIEDRIVVEPNSKLASELIYLSLEHVESVTGIILKEPSEPIEDVGRSITFRFDSRHVLYGKLRPYLNKVATPDFEGRCTTEMIPLLPRAGVSRAYLAWLLRRPQTVKAAMREKTGARMPRANMKHVLSLAVSIPNSIDEQERIAAQISERLSWVSEAKKACYEQIELLDLFAQKILGMFPSNSQSGSNNKDKANE